MFSHWLYLNGLLVLESDGGPMLMFHGTTKNGADNIIQHGLRDRSKFDVTNMAGEFWCTSNYEYASLMALMDGYDPPTEENPPVVLKFSLPESIFSILRDGKDYDQHGEGAFEFRSRAFRVLNKAIANTGGFQVAPISAEAQQKWKALQQKQHHANVDAAILAGATRKPNATQPHPMARPSVHSPSHIPMPTKRDPFMVTTSGPTFD